MNMTLTPEQSSVVDRVIGFLLSEETEFFLFGSAGCGKSFLIQHFCSKDFYDQLSKTAKLFNFNLDTKCAFITATTNKAAKLLEKDILKIRRFGFVTQVSTIYSLLHVTVKTDYITKKSSLVIPKDIHQASRFLKNCLVIVDECSMLGSFKSLLTSLTKNIGFKIIYVGDPYQLPPVNDTNKWISNIKNESKVELYSPVRNASDKDLVNLCNQLRSVIDSKSKQLIKTNGTSIVHLSDAEAKKWLNKYDESTESILSYTNTRALEYIDYVCKLRGQSETIGANQYLIVNERFVNDKDESILPEEIVKVTTCNKTHVKFPLEHLNSLSLTVYSLGIACGSSKKVSKKFMFIPPLTKSKVLSKYKHKLSNAMYWSIENNFVDLRPAIAFTIHKSQGSTYDTVLVDLDSFASCKDPDLAARLLYVAVSRARNKVFFYGTLPKKFGEVV